MRIDEVVVIMTDLETIRVSQDEQIDSATETSIEMAMIQIEITTDRISSSFDR